MMIKNKKVKKKNLKEKKKTTIGFERSYQLLNKYCSNFPRQQFPLGSFCCTLLIGAYILSFSFLVLSICSLDVLSLRRIRFHNALAGIWNKLNNTEAAKNCSELEKEQQVKWFIYCLHLWLIFFFLT